MTRAMLTTQLFAAAAMLLVTVGTLPAAAQTFDAAVEAYERGDYATALAGFQTYAAQGNATAQFNLGVMYDVERVRPVDTLIPNSIAGLVRGSEHSAISRAMMPRSGSASLAETSWST